MSENNTINNIANIIGQLGKYKGLVGGDKSQLLDMLVQSNPNLKDFGGILNAVNGKDISSFLPILSMLQNKQNPSKETNIVPENSGTKAFGLSPIAEIATGEIIKDIAILLK